MILAWALAVLLLAEGLAIGLLASLAGRADLVGQQRLLLEAELAVGSALARSRVEQDALLGSLPAGSRLGLPPPAVPGWQVEAWASRDTATVVVELGVLVRRGRAPGGRAFSSRRGTLLLRIKPADTALVMDDRPRY